MPIPNNPKWAPREYSRLRSAKDKGSPGTSWKPMQEYASQLNSLTEFCKSLWKEMANIKKSQAATVEMYPFRIYSPPAWTYNPPSTGSISWRSFKVRNGCVLTQKVSMSSQVFGCDGVKYHDQQYYPLPVENNLYVVPVSSSQYWFWIEELTSSLPNTGSYLLRYGANPAVASVGNPHPWASFPSASSQYVPIGFVDTNTSGSTQQSYVRQFQRTDVVATGNAIPNLPVFICNDVTGVAEEWLIVGTKVSSSA